jgi:imidazolonepropionase-like amidohydrolase
VGLGALCLGLFHARTATADTKAFVDARIFDGSGKPAIETGTIVVQNGRIVAADSSAKVKAPKGAQTIILTGKTITPGLINAHGHVSDAEGRKTGAPGKVWRASSESSPVTGSRRSLA